MKEIQPKDSIEEQIGFSFIKEELLASCSSESARLKVQKTAPFQSVQKLQLSFNELEEYTKFAGSFSREFNFLVQDSISNNIKNASKDGYLLAMDEIVIISDFLSISLPIFKKLNNFEFLNHLSKYIHPTHHLQSIKIEIDNVLAPNGKIKPNASKLLQKLLKKEEELKDQIWKVLMSVYKDKKNKGLTAESEPRISNGRYVIPIKSSEVSSIKGILQGRSGGKGVSYIEPIEVYEANNALRLVDLEIKDEIDQILRNLTTVIGSEINSILHAQDKFFALEFLNAKYLYAKKWDGIIPAFTESEIEVKELIHPQLQAHLMHSDEKMQPLTFSFSDKKRLMIISGPNAGGKSVALKTICLALYLAHCGIPISSSKDPKLIFMDGLLVDIGDNQSIDDDLSTYSAHLNSMRNFLTAKCKLPFIAIDEIGAGTDPQLGGPMAEAMIEEFSKKGYYGVITTHFSNLKSLELSYVFNASMLYDLDRLTPLYNLSIGNPGSSFVFELAKRIKIDQRVINRAKNLAKSDESDLEDMLTELDKEKVSWHNKNKEIHQKNESLDKLVKDYEDLKTNLLKEKRKILSKAKKDAEWILKDANKAIENTVREIKEGKAKKEIVKSQRINIEKKKESLNKVESKSAIKVKAKKPEKIIWKVGDWASIDGETQSVEILKLRNNKAEVVYNNIRTLVAIKRLMPGKKEIVQQKRSNSLNNRLMDKLSSFNSKLDIRGKRLDDAEKRIYEFLDTAYSLGQKDLSIVHGKGEGALRKATKAILKSLPYISSWKYEHADRGGEGVTHIELK